MANSDTPVTFLLTDVEGSTRLWDERPDAMRSINARHDDLVAGVVTGRGGTIVRSRAEGDSAFAVFADPPAAVAAALDLQRAIASEPWAGGLSVRVRMALHSGAIEDSAQLYGPVINRCARLRAIGHGGQTLLSSAAAELVRGSLPAGASLVDRGEHRLKDLAQSEHVFELVHPDIAATFPPLRSVDVANNNLPAPSGHLFGRDAELDAMDALLDQHRLVTLVGPGGIGKTRLAVEAGRRRSSSSGSGVWLVELAPVTDGALVTQAVAAAVGVRDQPGRPLTGTIVDHLVSRSALVILDNCEHVTDGVADLIGALLPGAPGVTVLATSREALGVGGEHLHPLGALGAAASAALFEDRAGDVGDPDIIARICERLDGIPLAVEMVAASAATIPLDEILDGVAARAGTGALRATIEWSHELLDDDERILFRRLAAFGGDFNLDAAEHVAAAAGGLDPDEVLDVLARLATKSLVDTRHHVGDVRYRMLPTIRQFAAERLDGADEGPATRAAHLDWFFDLAVDARSTATQATDDEGMAALVGAFDLLDIDHPNLLAAMTWPAAAGAARRQVELGSYLMEYWDMRGHWTEGRALLEDLAGRDTGVWKGRAQALSAAGLLAERMAVFDAARASYEAALLLWHALDGIEEPRLAASSRVWLTMRLGHLARLAADWEAARRFGEESLELSRTLEWPAGVSTALCSLGILDLEAGRAAAAGSALTEAVAVCRAEGHTPQLLDALQLLAGVEMVAGDLDRAARHADEALELSRALGDERRTAAVLADVAELQRLRGDPGMAADNAATALSAQEAVGDRREAAQTRLTLAALARDGGDVEVAGQLAAAAVEELKTVGDPIEVALAYCLLASVERAAGRSGEAGTAGALAALGRVPVADRGSVIGLVAGVLARGGDDAGAGALTAVARPGA